MLDLLTPVRRLFQPVRPSQPAPGLYSFLRQNGQEKTRLHLRLESFGDSLLMVNAARAYQLNPSAALMAYLSLNGIADEEAIRLLGSWFQAPLAAIRADYLELSRQVDMLSRPDEHCALCELDLATSMPFSAKPSAPYRMDLALTYRCQNDCAHCYNARERSYPELDTAQWRRVLDRVWQAGIPHVVFTGGEPTLRADLPDLIAHAQQNGQIAGMNSNGRRLANPSFVQKLVDAGLDHVQITLESHNPAIHDEMVGFRGAWEQTVAGLRNTLSSQLYVMTNTTLLENNASWLRETLHFLAELGVPTVGLNALIYSGKGTSVGTGLREEELPALLEIAQELTQKHNQRLIWYTPTRYCGFDPTAAELGVKGCTAALYSMCIEPDGAVLPCQSYYTPVGNILRDPWDAIWNHELSLSLRERRDIDPLCHTCDLLDACGGGCPLSRLSDPDHKVQPVRAYQPVVEVR